MKRNFLKTGFSIVAFACFMSVSSSGFIQSSTDYVQAEETYSANTDTQITKNKKNYYTLSYDEERQWLSFTTTDRKAFYRVTTKNVSSNDRLYFYLSNANDEELAKMEYLSKNNAKYIDLKLDPNTTYYIECRSYKPGNYSVQVDELIDDVPNSKEESKEISMGKTYTQTLNASIDEDWYKFTTGSKEEYYNLKVSNLSIDRYMYCYLFNGYDEELWKNDYLYKNKNDNTNILLKANTTYYVKCYSNEPLGNYSILVQKAKIAVSNIQLSKNSIALKVKKSFKLSATVSPSNATDKNVVWKSSNNSIATVTQSGVVNAKKKGSAVITCSPKDGSDAAVQCYITVK